MNFETLYDLASEKVNFFDDKLLAIYLFLIAGISMLIFYTRNRKTKNPKALFIGLGFIFISSILLLVLLIGKFHDINKAKQIIKSKTFFVVEGTPVDYHTLPETGHGWEEFTINGVYFAYSDYNLDGAGYHNAASLGGVIVPDKYFRLTYYISPDNYIDSNKILKIEVRQ